MRTSRVLPIPRVLVATALLAAGTLCGASAAEESRAEIGVLAGAGLVDGDLEGGPYGAGSVGPVLGLRGAGFFGRRLSWFADAVVGFYPTDLAPGEVERVAFRTGLEVFLGPPANAAWFLSGGAGWAEFDYEAEGRDFDRPLGSLGVGQRMRMRNGTFFRWELRGELLFGNSGARGDTVANAEILAGWTFGLGARVRPEAAPAAAAQPGAVVPPSQTAETPAAPPRRSRRGDEDGDGVPDRRDRCAFTPPDLPVDEVGCALDSDGDEVPDGMDPCPDTPAGAWVDPSGCPVDFDRDGVPNGIDECPSTPAGAVVDGKGCPLDGDADGIPNGIDRCPDTPRGTVVDSVGCVLDSDGDGVPDRADRCPRTPRGVSVDGTGCPPDADGDGVADPDDRCPGTLRGARVDLAGCPEVSRETASLLEGRAPLVLEGTYFDIGDSELDEDAEEVLDRIAEDLLARPDVRVEIGGHTDSTGSEEKNVELSRRRAEAVREYLIEAGIAADRLVASGYGSSRPVADNDTFAGRARNRRVELKLLD